MCKGTRVGWVKDELLERPALKKAQALVEKQLNDYKESLIDPDKKLKTPQLLEKPLFTRTKDKFDNASNVIRRSLQSYTSKIEKEREEEQNYRRSIREKVIWRRCTGTYK